jgi:hypothetical protein
VLIADAGRRDRGSHVVYLQNSEFAAGRQQTNKREIAACVALGEGQPDLTTIEADFDLLQHACIITKDCPDPIHIRTGYCD